MKRKLIELSGQVILLADSSKIGLKAVGFVVPAAQIDGLITDQAVSYEEIERLRGAGVEVEVV